MATTVDIGCPGFQKDQKDQDSAGTTRPNRKECKPRR